MRFYNIFKRNEIQPVVLKILQYIILNVTGDLTKYRSLAIKKVVIPMERDTQMAEPRIRTRHYVIKSSHS